MIPFVGQVRRVGENGVPRQNCSQEPQLQFKNCSGGEEIICARSTLYDVGGNMLPKHSSMVVGDETSSQRGGGTWTRGWGRRDRGA